MTKQEIENLIIDNIYTNDAGLITGIILQQVLLSMTDFSEDQVTDIISQLHTHPNKTVLDQIIQGNIDVLSKLSLDVDGKLRVGTDLYSVGEISAYGAGDGAGGGTSYDRLDTWEQYVAGITDGWVLSAFLGKDLHNRVTTLETSPVTDDKNFVFNQSVPANIWTVTHNLGKYPSIMVVDSAGTEVVGDIKYTDINTIQVTFTSEFSGKAYLN